MTNIIDINGLSYMRVGDIQVGAATTSVSFTGLDIGKDDDYLLVSEAVGVNTALYLNVNGNVTQTNYYSQYLLGDSTTVAGGRLNSGDSGAIVTGTSTILMTKLKLTNSGYSVFQTNEIRRNGSTLQLINHYNTSTFTSASITTLTLTSSVANAIGIGSRFQLYKLVAEKVADIIVATATTSVDITGLNITKDSEYMLVSDYKRASVGGSISLFINNNLTATNYWRQFIDAASTAVTGARENNNYMCYADATTASSIAITSLKLTNSGYFISQTKGNRYIGTSSTLISDSYNTSIFTTTNITQLNIVSQTANSIAIGSRFTLYKMK